MCHLLRKFCFSGRGLQATCCTVPMTLCTRKKNKMSRPSHIANKRRTKDIDQCHDDMKVAHKFQPGALPENEDLPGMGQFYCIPCSRYFANAEIQKEHERSKLHKRRKAK